MSFFSLEHRINLRDFTYITRLETSSIAPDEYRNNILSYNNNKSTLNYR